MDNEWIKVEEELPPQDGTYEVCIDPAKICTLSIYDVVFCFYDGYGFIHHYYNHYVNPNYWRNVQKKYGKQNV